MIGQSSKIKQVLKLIEKVARSDSTVLITGESGTGKELVARQIHNMSKRRDHAFVPINCGAIPKELLESELFGYEKGAFTGANRTKPGRFELANGGTVFLDEIGDMIPDLQVKVLRVLQERSFERVGGVKEVKVDIRVVAATHKDLEEAVRKGDFREDLYYRLNVIPIRVPALRERIEDIPLLVEHFLRHFLERMERPDLKMDDNAIKILMSYDWPGNIRELENTIERIVVLAEGDVIYPDDLPHRILNSVGFKREKETAVALEDKHDASASGALPFSYSELSTDIDAECPFSLQLLDNGRSLPDLIRDIETCLISQALKKVNGVKSKAADILGLKRTTLVEKMKKLGIS